MFVRNIVVEQELYNNEAKLIFEDDLCAIFHSYTKKAHKYFCVHELKSLTFNNFLSYYSYYIILWDKRSNHHWLFEHGIISDNRFQIIDMKLFNKTYPYLVKALLNSTKDPFVLLQILDRVPKALKKYIVTVHKSALQYIKNPSYKLILLAIKKFGTPIRYVNNPSIKLQKMAIDCLPSAIKFIVNQTDDIKYYALMKDSYVFQHIKQPTEDMKKLAILDDAYNIHFVHDPSEELQWYAISNIKNINQMFVSISYPTDNIAMLMWNIKYGGYK